MPYAEGFRSREPFAAHKHLSGSKRM
jgi:hypothetical protein